MTEGDSKIVLVMSELWKVIFPPKSRSEVFASSGRESAPPVSSSWLMWFRRWQRPWDLVAGTRQVAAPSGWPVG